MQTAVKRKANKRPTVKRYLCGRTDVKRNERGYGVMGPLIPDGEGALLLQAELFQHFYLCSQTSKTGEPLVERGDSRAVGSWEIIKKKNRRPNVVFRSQLTCKIKKK